MRFKRTLTTIRISSVIPAPLLSLFVVLIICQSYANADGPVVEHGEDPDTGLKYWLWNNDGFLLRLTQRLPDQTRAYFEARGFDKASTETAGTSCIFQTMIKNTGTNPSDKISADIRDWQVISGDVAKPLLHREYWRNYWLDQKQPESARVAFEWSLLPESVEYDINDYNWGMSSYGLAPGSQFDLIFTWQRQGKKYQGRINDVICPHDIHPEPAAQ